MTNEKYVSIAEAARRLGVARGTVYQWVRWGALQTKTHPANKRTLVSVESIEFMNSPSRHGVDADLVQAVFDYNAGHPIHKTIEKLLVHIISSASEGMTPEQISKETFYGGTSIDIPPALIHKVIKAHNQLK